MAQTIGTGFTLGTTTSDPFGTGGANLGWGSGSQNGTGNHVVTNRADNGGRIDMDGDGLYEFAALNPQGSDNLIIMESTADNTYVKVWGISLNGSNLNSGGLAVGDSDGDGMLEIVASDAASDLVRIWEYDPALGAGQIVDGTNPADTPKLSRAVTDPIGMTIGDLDGDGFLEILMTSTNDTDSFIIVESSADDTWSANDSTAVGTAGFGATGISHVMDLDGDLTNEVVIGPDSQARADNAFYVYTWDGSTFTVEATLPLAASGGGRNSVFVYDLDSMGTPEIILADQATTDRVYVYESTAANSYAADAGTSGIVGLTGEIFAPSVGDRDSDGNHEIYLAFDDNSHRVIYYEHDGTAGAFAAANFGAQQVLITLDTNNKDPRDVAYGMGSLDVGGDTRGDIIVSDQDARLLALESDSDGSQVPIELLSFMVD